MSMYELSLDNAFLPHQQHHCYLLLLGLALAYSVHELEIQKNGAVKVVRLKGEEGGFVPTMKEEDDNDEDDDDVKDDADNDGKATDDGVMSFLQVTTNVEQSPVSQRA